MLDVGKVAKPHGLAGEVVVQLWTHRVDRLVPGAVFRTDAGDLVVRAVRPHQDRHLVLFDGVNDRSGAEVLRGVILRATALDAPGTIWVHELIGAEVASVGGRALGVVAAVEANPASDLLVLDGGGLIPLRFVVDHRPGVRVTVDIPDGLLD